MLLITLPVAEHTAVSWHTIHQTHECSQADWASESEPDAYAVPMTYALRLVIRDVNVVVCHVNGSLHQRSNLGGKAEMRPVISVNIQQGLDENSHCIW